MRIVPPKYNYKPMSKKRLVIVFVLYLICFFNILIFFANRFDFAFFIELKARLTGYETEHFIFSVLLVLIPLGLMRGSTKGGYKIH